MNGFCPRNYTQLHQLDHLEDLVKGLDSFNSKDCYVICVELILYSLSGTIKNLKNELKAQNFRQVNNYLKWLYDLTKLLTEISKNIGISVLNGNVRVNNKSNIIGINNSEAFRELDNELRAVDNLLCDSLLENSNAVEMYDLAASNAHFMKLFIYEIQISFDTLQEFSVQSSGYSETLKKMTIYDGPGIAFFREFRLTHQLQEVFFKSINKLLENSVRDLETGATYEVLGQLSSINSISRYIIQTQRILIENLSIDHYHSFRQFLGESSGIQSQNIRKDCFMKSYPAFSSSIKKLVEREVSKNSDSKEVKNFLTGPHTNPESHMYSLILKEAICISDFLHYWREIHLHFPRNLLGGQINGYGTSSMIGVKNGIETVEKMIKNSKKNDYIAELTKSGLCKKNFSIHNLKIERMLLETAGRMTQAKFPEVQKKAHDAE